MQVEQDTEHPEEVHTIVHCCHWLPKELSNKGWVIKLIRVSEILLISNPPPPHVQIYIRIEILNFWTRTSSLW